MELEFLGTGAGTPSSNRNVASIALKLLNERNEIWLFDVGEGTQQQILNTDIHPRKINRIFITHLHGDHIFGLPGFLSSRSFQGGLSPLTIYGPKGIEEYVRTSLHISESHLTYKIKFKELPYFGTILNDDTFYVETMKLDHKISSYGFRIVEKNHPGKLLMDKLNKFGTLSGPMYGKLKNGEIVTLNDGTLINGKDFIGPSQKGRIVTIIGDTRKAKNSVILAKNADILVHESTFANEEKDLAHQYFHTTSLEAAEIAKEANVRKLILTHISSRYISKGIANLKKDAKKVFNNVIVAKDFEKVDIPFIKK